MAIKLRVLPHRSFNTHDCNVTKGDGRFDVEVDMERRMGLVVRALQRAHLFADSQDLADHLNKRLGSSYSQNDMLTTLKKLEKVNVVQRTGRGWRLAPGGAALYGRIRIIKLN